MCRWEPYDSSNSSVRALSHQTGTFGSRGAHKTQKTRSRELSAGQSHHMGLCAHICTSKFAAGSPTTAAAAAGKHSCTELAPFARCEAYKTQKIRRGTVCVTISSHGREAEAVAVQHNACCRDTVKRSNGFNIIRSRACLISACLASTGGALYVFSQELRRRGGLHNRMHTKKCVGVYEGTTHQDATQSFCVGVYESN